MKRERVVAGRTQGRCRKKAVNLIRLIVPPMFSLFYFAINLDIRFELYLFSSQISSIDPPKVFVVVVQTKNSWLQYSTTHPVPHKTHPCSLCQQNYVSRSTHTVSTTDPLKHHLYYPNTVATIPGPHHQSPAPAPSYATKPYLSTTTPDPLHTTYAPH
jgi:hypothetical protein